MALKLDDHDRMQAALLQAGVVVCCDEVLRLVIDLRVATEHRIRVAEELDEEIFILLHIVEQPVDMEVTGLRARVHEMFVCHILSSG
jgi:hypothetical protein